MSLSSCLKKSAKNFTDAEKLALRSAVAKNVAAKMDKDAAELAAVQAALDEAIAERQEVIDAIIVEVPSLAGDNTEAKPSTPPTPTPESAANRSEGATIETKTPADLIQKPAILSGKEGGISDKNIQDFGEKIAGARKDYAAKLEEAKSADIASVPLSQSWPEPDYAKLLEGGADPWAVAFMHAARDEIPTKPSKSWKLRRWVEQVEQLRDVSLGLAEGKYSVARAKELLAASKALKPVADRLDLYQEVGHEKSLKGIRIREATYSIHDKIAYDPPKVIWSIERPPGGSGWIHWPRIVAMGDTSEQAIAKFKESWLATTPEQDTAKAIDFQLYSGRTEDGKRDIYIGKKIGKNVVTLKGGFTDVKEARAWKESHQAELVSMLAKYKDVPYERRESNSPRVGIDHRNGANVTPERFTEAFGFRGVQFGNYVEGDLRQRDLNEAYDALMDLAGVLGIPSKALSLNGELGLAFGSRGTGGTRAPAAHYEPVEVVINLTKAKGAGSLAHEWFHGVDNYFSRMAGGKLQYLTETPGAAGNVRPEMVEAFKKVMQAIKTTSIPARSRRLDQTRSKPYWATGLEMAARSFESYIVAKLQDQNASNDYLANIVSEDYWKAATALGIEKDNTFPYPTTAEMTAIRGAFDQFFQTIETRETDKGTALFQRGNEPLKITPWKVIETGLPATFYAYRGEGNERRGLLTEKWQRKYGRTELLGEGIYVAPTQNRAAHYGDTSMVRVTLNNPFVLRNANGTDIVGLNLEDVKAQGHDGIVILAGRAEGNEDMAQAVVFPEFAEQVERNVTPLPGELVKGATVRLTMPAKYSGQTYLAGTTGKIVSLSAWGHPNIKLADGKTISALNLSEIEVLSDKFPRNPQALFARGESTSGITVSTLRAEISKAFGPRAERMVGDILIPLETQAQIADVSELADVVPLIREGDRISGFYHPGTGKTYAILENLAPEGVKGLALHEIGVHLGMEGLLGKEGYAKLVRQMDTMRRAGNKAVIEAHEQAAKQAAKSSQIPEETIAYLVTNRPELPFVKRIVAQIKAFLFSKFGILGDRLTVDDIAALARASVLHASEGVRKGEAQFMVAWHGSPHDFDQFSLHKIGTGEGAAAYGWGMYFAGNKDVAQYYKETLAQRSKPELEVHVGETPIQKWAEERGFDVDAARRVAARLQATSLNTEQTKADFEKAMTTDLGASEPYLTNFKEAALLTSLLPSDNLTNRLPPQGKLYQVNLTPKEDEYLDWDKPLSEQSEGVRKALGDRANERMPLLDGKTVKETLSEFSDIWPSIINVALKQNGTIEAALTRLDKALASSPNADTPAIVDRINEKLRSSTLTFEQRPSRQSGAELYQSIAREAKDGIKPLPGQQEAFDRGELKLPASPQEFASRYLFSIGIPGIRYLDGSSRNVPDTLYEIVSDGKNFNSTRYDTRAIAERQLALYKKQFPDAVIKEVQVQRNSNYVIFDDSLVTIESKFSRSQDQTLTEALGAGSVSSREPAVAEGGPNSLRGYAETIGNILVDPAFVSKGFGGLEVPSQREVLLGMRALGRDPQIRDAIVELIPASVMDILSRQQLTPEMLFHDGAVLKNLLSVDSSGSVSTAVDVANALRFAITSVAAKNANASFGVFRRNGEGNAATGTSISNGLHSAIINQIKPIGNTGAFDPTNPDIRMMSDASSKDPSEMESSEVEAAIAGKTLQDAARYLVKTAKDDRKLIAAKALMNLQRLEAAGVTLDLKIAHIGDTVPRTLLVARGLTDWRFTKDDNHVTVWLNGADVTGKVGVSKETLLHELIHAATSGIVRLGNLKKNANLKAAQDVKDLYAVANHVRSHFNTRIADRKAGKATLTEFEEKIYQRANNALDDADEVLAWGLSNQAMQEYMESIPYPAHKSAWTAFVSLIRKLLNLPAHAETALSEILRVGENLMSDNINELIGLDTVDGQNTGIQAKAGGGMLAQRSNPTFARNVQGGADEITAPDWVKEQPADMQETLRKAGAWKPKETLQERFVGWMADWQQKLKQGMVDQFDPIKSLDYHAYMLARMTKSAAGPLESALFDGAVFLDKDGAIDVNYEKGGFIGRMQALKGEHDRFFAWVIGNRAARLMEEGREHNFSKEDIARLKTLNRGKMGDKISREITYAKALADLNRYNKSILDIAQKAGLIDGESRPFWEKDFYIPFYRMTEGDTTKGPVKSGGLVRQYAFKTLKGGEQAIGDPMENILKNWAHLIDASLKNQAAVASLDAAVNVGVAHETTANEKGAVFVMKNGKKTYYGVDDPFVLDAINSLGFSGFSGPAMKVMTSFKRWLTYGVTISPTFRVRNVIRDSISMIGTNPANYNVLDNVLTGWRLTKEDSPSYASMIAGGGVIRFGTLEQDGATNIKRIVASGVDAGTILDSPAKVKAMLKSAYDWWMRTGDRSENVNRAALYQKLRDEGKSHLEASYAARDTMDFSMMGTWSAIRFLAQTVPFFNARLQGLYKLGRGAAEDPRRFAYVVGATALASMALLLAYKDDDDWKQREDFDRESFWWFKIGDKAFRIPKPFEIGALGTLAERGLEALITDELTGKQFAQRMGSVVGQQLSMNPVPQLFMPMIEMWANKDSFTGRPIESMGMDKLSPSERIGPRTSAFAQLVGKNGIVSPVQIDHIINGYFGWLGTHAVATADFGIRPFMDVPAKPAMRIDDVFALGDFVRDMPAYQSKYVTRLYEQSREVQQVMADMRAYQKIGATEKAAEILKEHGDKIKLYRLYTHAEKQLTQINQQIKMTQRRSGDADAKRARLDQLYAQKNRVAKLTEQRAQSTQR